MRTLTSPILVLTACSIAAWGQAENSHAGHGYVFGAIGSVAPGGGGTTAHFGGGGEAFVYKGLGVGAEIGYLGPTASLSDGFGLFSANGSYHFGARTPRRKVVPFVTGGYSLAFRNGHANLANFGGGITYWFHDRVGLRAEFRDHLYPCSGCTAHFWGFRLGLALR